MTAISDPIRHLLLRWRDDPSSTFQTWFLWEERLKNFRSIRRGIAAVVREMEEGTFGNVYKGSSLEVEHTTSIYSGIVRMLDLALGLPEHSAKSLVLVAPNAREEEVRAQLNRPAFSRFSDLNVMFLPCNELSANRGAMARFGQGHRPVEVLARWLA